MAGEVRQIEGEMIELGMDPTSLGHYVVEFFWSGTGIFCFCFVR